MCANAVVTELSSIGSLAGFIWSKDDSASSVSLLDHAELSSLVKASGQETNRNWAQIVLWCNGPSIYPLSYWLMHSDVVMKWMKSINIQAENLILHHCLKYSNSTVMFFFFSSACSTIYSTVMVALHGSSMLTGTTNC